MSDELELKKIVGEVAAAYFSNSHVTPGEITSVISQIASSLAAVGAPAVLEVAEPAVEEEKKLTSAQIRRSITPDGIISFEDNKPYKTMRRHLAARGLTPEEYRAKWGLPRDYPMVAPSYSQMRANFAKQFGLGARRITGAASPQADSSAAPAVEAASAAPPPAAAASPASAPEATSSPAGRGRRAAAERPSRATAARAGRPPSVQAKEGRASTGAKAKGRRTPAARGRAKKGASESPDSAE